ncbi:hypothetical protein PIB30_114038, partial [Stylosanthes scabra]|nr:hypothetical protein [Stylosanthes scabra]
MVSHVTIDDLVTMWAMVNDIKIYWPYFIAYNMLRFTKSDHSNDLGYAYLWTRIFEYLGIDVSGESGRRISQNNIIDERTIHHMGRGIEEGEEQQASTTSRASSSRTSRSFRATFNEGHNA